MAGDQIGDFNIQSDAGSAVLDPQKRVVSILYADIAKSTHIVSNLDPEDASDVLDPVISLMRDAVRYYGGRVVRVEGDGIKAIFGTLESREDHAVRATLAGQKIISDIQDNDEAAAFAAFGVRVGVHSGYTIVRWQSNDFGGGIDTVGSAAHIAAKIQAAGQINSVCVSDSTADLLRGLFEITQNEIINMGPDTEPVLSFVVGKNEIDAASTSLAFLGAPTWFVGRENELEKFSAWLRPQSENRPGAVTIFGDAGVGKSRLLHEAVRIAQDNGIHSIKVGGLQVFKDTPFRLAHLLVQQIVDHTFEDVSGFLSGKVPYCDLTALETEAIAKIYSKDRPAFSQWSIPEDRKIAALKSSILKLLTAYTAERLFILVIEDMHAADLDSLDCFKYVLDNDSSGNFMLIITSRLTDSAIASQLPGAVIRLEPLSGAHALTLAQSLIFEASAPKASKLAERIVSRANGSPLALVELSKLHSAGSGAKTQGGNIPLTLEPILRTRLDQLSAHARELTKYACVFGRESQLDSLQAVLGWSEAQTKTAYLEAVEKGVFTPAQDDNPVFIHDLFQEVCYNAILRRQRKSIHSKIYAAMLASLENEAAHANHQILAHHAYEGGKTEEALKYLLEAFREANGAGAIQTVRSLYLRAEEICDTLEGGLYRKAKFAMLSFDATHRLSDEHKLLPVFQDVLHLHSDKLAREEKILIRCNIGIIKWVSGQPKAGLGYTAEALELLEGMQHTALEFYAAYVHACVEFATGNVRSSVHRLSQQSEILSGEFGRKRWGQSISIPGILARTFCVWYAVDYGDLDLARRLYREAEDIQAQTQNTYGRLLCDLASGYIRFRSGQFHQAATVLAQAYQTADKSYYSLAPMISAWGALCLIETGDLQQAAEILDRESQSGRLEIMRNANRFYHFKAMACLHFKREEFTSALRSIDKAIESAASNKDPVHQAYGYFQKSQFLSASPGQKAAAKQCLQMTLHLARQCEMRPLTAKCETLMEAT